MYAMYTPKKFDKMIWIDPNNITQQHAQFKLYFGNQFIHHFPKVQTARQYIQSDPHSKFIVMVSSKIFLPDNGRHVSMLTQNYCNVYPKVIIFCGTRSQVLENKLMIAGVEVDTFEVMGLMEKIEVDLQKKQKHHNWEETRISFVRNGKNKSQLRIEVESTINELFWQGIRFNCLDAEDFQETVKDTNPNQKRDVAFSIDGDYPKQTICSQFLQQHQSITTWYIITNDPIQQQMQQNFQVVYITKAQFQQLAIQEARKGLETSTQ